MATEAEAARRREGRHAVTRLLRHPGTEVQTIAATLFPSMATAVKKMNEAGHNRNWEKSANIAPVDERVLWTIDPEAETITMYYRVLDIPTRVDV